MTPIVRGDRHLTDGKGVKRGDPWVKRQVEVQATEMRASWPGYTRGVGGVDTQVASMTRGQYSERWSQGARRHLNDVFRPVMVTSGLNRQDIFGGRVSE